MKRSSIVLQFLLQGIQVRSDGYPHYLNNEELCGKLKNSAYHKILFDSVNMAGKFHGSMIFDNEATRAYKWNYVRREGLFGMAFERADLINSIEKCEPVVTKNATSFQGDIEYAKQVLGRSNKKLLAYTLINKFSGLQIKPKLKCSCVGNGYYVYGCSSVFWTCTNGTLDIGACGVWGYFNPLNMTAFCSPYRQNLLCMTKRNVTMMNPIRAGSRSASDFMEDPTPEPQKITEVKIVEVPQSVSR